MATAGGDADGTEGPHHARAYSSLPRRLSRNDGDHATGHDGQAHANNDAAP